MKAWMFRIQFQRLASRRNEVRSEGGRRGLVTLLALAVALLAVALVVILAGAETAQAVLKLAL